MDGHFFVFHLFFAVFPVVVNFCHVVIVFQMLDEQIHLFDVVCIGQSNVSRGNLFHFGRSKGVAGSLPD